MDVQEILQILVFFFLFVLPGILSARKNKERSRRPAPPPRPTAGPEAGKPKPQVDGGELWKKLMRGELDPDTLRPEAKGPVTERKPPVKPKPAAPLAQPAQPVRRKRAQRRAIEPLAPPPERPLTRQRSSESDTPLTREPSSEGRRPLSREPSSEGARPLTRQPSYDSRQGKPLADVGSGLAPSEGQRAGHFADELAGRELRSSFTGRLAELTSSAAAQPVRPVLSAAAVEWRRAVVLSEILGPPVALRDPQAGLGSPPALR